MGVLFVTYPAETTEAQSDGSSESRRGSSGLEPRPAAARLAAVAPLEASSGQNTRHRLNRRGDRQLNRALHTIAVTRSRYCPHTQAYIAKRTAEGKTPREAQRCLKRYIARQIYRLLQHPKINT